jgi:hypothetical protein
MPAAIPITYKGQVFKTKDRLAKHLGVSLSTLEKRIREGVPEDQWGSKKPIRTKKMVRPSDQITYQGEIFESRVQLAKHLGIPAGRLKARILAGRPEECWGEKGRGETYVSYAGKTWIRCELAHHLGVSPTCLAFRVKEGWPEERWGEEPDFRSQTRLKAVVYQGVTYKCRSDLADHLGIADETLLKRIKIGWPEEDWNKPSRNRWSSGLTYEGKSYKNPVELAACLSISERQFYKWLKKLDGDVEKAVEKAKVNNSCRPVEYRGETFPTLTSLSKHLGVHIVTLKERIDKGLPEEAWATGNSRGAGYCLANVPEEVQQMAISLAGSLGVEPAAAYAQMLEGLV